MDTRFKEIREWYSCHKWQDAKKFSAQMLADEFCQQDKPYYCPCLYRGRISKLENGLEKKPLPEEIKAYCLFFNTTADYLLGISDIRSQNADLRIAGKITGLNDETLINISNYDSKLKDMLNKLAGFKDVDLLKLLLSDLWIYGHNRYDEYSVSNPDNGYANKKLDSLDNQAVKDLLETEKYRDILKAVFEIYKNEAEKQHENEIQILKQENEGYQKIISEKLKETSDQETNNTPAPKDYQKDSVQHNSKQAKTQGKAGKQLKSKSGAGNKQPNNRQAKHNYGKM